ncbi:hypothetical protein Tco_0087729 [Tanacetum coccineum]
MAAVKVPQTLEYRGDQLNAASVLEDFQDSPDDEEDTRSSQEYMNDLEEEYQARALLDKSKSFFKKGTQSSFISVTFSTKLLHLSEHKPELRYTKDFEAKYNKVKAKLALLSSSASSPKSSSGKNKGLIAETYEWDEEEVIDQLTEDTSSFRLKEPVFVKSSADNSEVSITDSNRPKLFKDEDSTLSNHDTSKHPLPSLEKLAGAKPVPGPKTIKSNLKSNPTFKAKTLKGITLKEPSSTPTKDNKKGSSALKTSSAPAGKLKNMKVEDDPPLAIVMKELNELKS